MDETPRIEDFLRVLGPDHPDTLSARNSLAITLSYLGRLDEALELQRRNLSDCIRVLGIDHPLTQWVRDWLEAHDLPDEQP